MSALDSPIIVGDARQELAHIEPASIDMVLTSPPYFRLRDYATAGQIGLEEDVDDWARQLTASLRAARRALVPTGTLWVNLGDSYATHLRQGARPKSLLLGPERLALRLVADGWVLRNKLIWQKTNPMPTSVRDRLACTWEVIYVFAKQSSYFFDLDALRVPHRTHLVGPQERPTSRSEAWRGPNSGSVSGLAGLKARGLAGHPLGKNPGDVWRIASSSYRGGHHATFPIALAERAIRGGCPEARCRACRSPWRRVVLHAVDGPAVRSALAPTCDCTPAGHEPGTVLDPFFGAGTTAIAAEHLGRRWLGIELNPAYAELARRRLHEARAGPLRPASATATKERRTP